MARSPPRSRRAAPPARPRSVCRPSRTTCRPSTTTCVDVGGGGRETPPRRVGTPAVRDAVQPDRDQVGAVADGDRARRRPSRARACPVAVAASQQLGGGEVPAALGGSRSSSSTPRASSNRSITAWLSLPRLSGLPASASAPGRADAVGQVPFGGGAEAHRRCRCPPSTVRSASVEVGGVHGGGRPGRAPRGRRSSSVGVRPCTARQASFSARCSDRCTCSGARAGAHPATVASWSPAPRGPSGSPHRSDRVRPGRRSASTRSAQRVGVAVAEAPLRSLQRLAVHRGRSGRACPAG